MLSLQIGRDSITAPDLHPHHVPVRMSADYQSRQGDQLSRLAEAVPLQQVLVRRIDFEESHP